MGEHCEQGNLHHCVVITLATEYNRLCFTSDTSTIVIQQLICLDCPSGSWGVGCQEFCQCGKHSEGCDPVTGECLCRAGYFGTSCDEGMHDP